MFTALFAFAIVANGPVFQAREYLVEVRGEPIVTEGTAAELFGRGEACMARHLTGGLTTSDVILSRDAEQGIVVARNALQYRDGWVLVWDMRSRMTLEARDGRFRLSHSNIERFNEHGGGWTPVGKWRGAGAEKAEAALVDQSNLIAACIRDAGQDDW